MTDVYITTEFAKVEPERQQVFGWASVTDVNGTPVIDHQSDVIEISELEKAAYDYVLDSRVGGEMHRRVGKSAPKQVATLIESFVVTPEKVEKLGLPEGSLPSGWWTGYQIHDPEVWDGVKKGKYTGFSVHGVGKRVAKELDMDVAEHVGKKADMDMREQLLQQAFAKASDEVTFAKNVALIADELAERDHPEAAYFGQVVKHLIGRHEQSDHDPTKQGKSRQGARHSRKEHERAPFKQSALTGIAAGVGGALPGLITRNPGFAARGARGGIGAGLVAGGVSGMALTPEAAIRNQAREFAERSNPRNEAYWRALQRQEEEDRKVGKRLSDRDVEILRKHLG